MKKILFAAAALSALAAAPAMAQSSTVTITGSIAPKCSGVADAAITGVLVAGTEPGSLSTTTAAGPNSATILCNGAGTTVSVTANPLTGPALPAGAAAFGFGNQVNYTATLNYVSGFTQGTVPPTDTTAAGAGTAQTAGLTNGVFRLDLSNIAASATTLIAGNYSGTTVITVNPL